MKHYYIVKRGMDLILSIIALIILWPVFLIIGALIKIESRGSILFKQKRIGRNKKEFLILKFRTMRTDTPKDMPTHLLQNPDVFITKVGRLLRKSSLDELPQIINIIKGDMSIIGPRPALWNQYDLIKERDKYGANDITPGLTGWAQVNGRDEPHISVKAELDGYYTINKNYGFDVKVFFITLYKVFKREGIKEGEIKIKAGNPSDFFQSRGN